MGDIVLTAGIRQNLLALQSTATLTSIAQNRLATGKKVNSALDNATNFFTSNALTARAGDLSALLDGMSNGIKTLQAADNGMTALTKTVESLQSALSRTLQDQTWQGATYSIDATAIGTSGLKNLTISGGAVTGSVNIALNTAATNGTKSVAATTGNYTAPVAAQPALYTAAAAYDTTGWAATEAITVTFGGNSVNATLTKTATLQQNIDSINGQILLNSNLNGKIKAENDGTGKLRITTIGNLDGAITVGGAGETAVFGVQVAQTGSDGLTSFSVDGTAIQLNAGDSTLSAAINNANLQLQAAGSNIEAFDNGDNKLSFRQKIAATGTIAITGTDSGLFAAGTAGTAGTNGAIQTVDQLVSAINGSSSLAGKVKATNDNGKLRITNLSTVDLTVAGATSTAIDGSVTTQTISGNVIRRNLIAEFNELRSQLDKIADDASYNGINLLRGDLLKMSFNEQNTSTLNIQSQNPNGINVTTLGIAIADDNMMSNDTVINARLDVLRLSLTTLRSQASAFGTKLALVQNRQDFTKMMINTLQTGADNLMLADTNEEGANLLALQTRQQLSTTALSLANQANQGVLRLFG